jgi:hypothetical protein
VLGTILAAAPRGQPATRVSVVAEAITETGSPMTKASHGTAMWSSKA